MNIDFTAYLGLFPYWQNSYAGSDGTDLVRLMNRDNIGRAVIASLRSVFDAVDLGNDEVFEAVARFPDRLIPSIVVNPYESWYSRDYLAECREKGAKVLRLFPFNHAYPLRSPDNGKLDQLMQDAAELGYVAVISYRLFMNWYFNVLPTGDVYDFATRYRNLPIVIETANYSEFSPTVEAAKANPNIYVGLSALTFMDGVERLVEELGAKRILAGTCAPLQIPSCGTIKVREALIGEDDKADILGGNVVRLLGLG